MIRRRPRIFLAIATSAFMLLGAPQAMAAPHAKKPTCQQINKQYPNGLASSVTAANVAERDGMNVPEVRPRLAFSLARKLKINRWTSIGVVCPTKAPVLIPEAASGFTSSTVGETYASLKWDEPYVVGANKSTFVLTGPGNIRQSSGYAMVDGLQPGTAYEYTLVVTNSAGSSTPVTLTVTTRVRPSYSVPDTGTREPIPTFEPSPVVAGYYATCSDARAAGVSLPLRRSEQPDLYNANTHLDRDGDGTACEWG